MKHFEVFQGRIGRINEPRQVGEDYVVNFTVAETPRIKRGEEWVDGETTWTECSIWGRKGLALAESKAIAPGTVVLVVGERTTRAYEAYTNRAGDKVPAGTTQSVKVNEIGVCVLPNTLITEITKKAREDQGGSAPAAKPAAKSKAAPAATKAVEDPFAEVFGPSGGDDTSTDPFAADESSSDPFDFSDTADEL